MSNKKQDQNKNIEKHEGLKPDPETLHKTDPQDNMKGPFSSAVHKVGEKSDSHESKESADKRKNENL